MTVDDRERLNLHRKLEAVLGTEEATTLMAHLPPVTWHDVANKDDLRALTDQVHAVEAVIRSDMSAEFADVRGEMRIGFAELRGEMNAIRGEIYKAVGHQTKWMVGFICGWSVIVLAVARLVL